MRAFTDISTCSRCCNEGELPRNGASESAAKFTSNLVEEAPVGSIGDNFRRA